MPNPFHLSITGATQGNISAGACDIKDREDTILCQKLDHDVSRPYDIQTGAITSKSVHKPLQVTKEFDKASPLIYTALGTAEEVTAKLEFYKTNATGNEVVYFTIDLEGAHIVKVKPWIPNCLDPDQESLKDMEDVQFTYNKITWTFVDGGIICVDEWKAPV